jgi:hypothetical protein
VGLSFSSSTASYKGKGYLSSFTNCTFLGNRACPRVCPALSSSSSSVNNAKAQGGHGGAVAVSSASLKLSGCLLVGNEAYSAAFSPGAGGALFLGGTGKCEATDTLFDANTIVPAAPSSFRRSFTEIVNAQGPLVTAILGSLSSSQLSKAKSLLQSSEDAHLDRFVLGSQVAVVGNNGSMIANFTGSAFAPSCLDALPGISHDPGNSNNNSSSSWSLPTAAAGFESLSALLHPGRLCWDVAVLGAKVSLNHGAPHSQEIAINNNTLNVLLLATRPVVGGSGGGSDGSDGGSSSDGPYLSNGPKVGSLEVCASPHATRGLGIWAIGGHVKLSGSTNQKPGVGVVMNVLRLVNASFETSLDVTVPHR